MSTDATNRLEKRAELYNQMADDRAGRIADGWTERPAEAVQPEPHDVHAMWHFSQAPQPEQAFWQMHDQLLQEALAQTPDPKPEDVQAAYKAAELGALQKVYPYRLTVAPVTNLEPDLAVKKAESVYQTVQRVAQGDSG